MKFEHNFENETYVINEETMSEEDFFERYFICEDCGEAFDIYDMCETDHGYLCVDCAVYRGYERCSDCGTWTLNYVTTEDTDNHFCFNCCTSLIRCDNCGDYFEHESSVRYNERRGEYYCDSCYPEDVLDAYHNFKNYGSYQFFGDENREDVPYMGFELEVDGGSEYDVEDTIHAINGHFPENYFHFEEDGSLDTGFEIISQPSSINYHLANESNYRDAWRDVVRNRFSSHDARSCGLHIHVDREYFGKREDTCIAKLLFLVERHWDNLLKFSRRRSDQIHWCDRYQTSPVKVIKGAKDYDFGRYYAINLTNDNTIEFRLWRGTLNINTFMATLKLTARICELAKTKTSIELAKMKFKDILGDDEQINNYWKTRTGEAE